MQRKVCPVILRKREGNVEVLLFQHPHAGVQIIKGTPNDGEDLLKASIREVWEESGLQISQEKVYYLDDKIFPEFNQKWYLYFCMVNEAREHWSWQTIDDYGHTFHFFWCTLMDVQSKFLEWDIHNIFMDALLYIRQSFINKELIKENK